MNDPRTIIVLAAAGLALVFLLFVFVVTFSLLRPWMQGFLSGAPVSIIELIGMRLRRIDVQAVMRNLIVARQSGVDLKHIDLQRAWLRGVDLDKVTLAYIQAQKEGTGETFDDLVDARQRGRLSRMPRA
jgi:uncharacterized protein YqfA (UPF0365 family)